MANYCKIINKKKLNLTQTGELLELELKNKFGFNSIVSFHDDSIEFVIHGWNFYVFVDDEKCYSFYDCPEQAMKRFNYHNPKLNKSITNSHYYYGLSCGYSYVYEYVKNFLADYNKSKIISDGIGMYKPFENKSRFNSFCSWMEYCETNRKKDKTILYVVSNLSGFSKDSILKDETSNFPELSDR